MQPPPGYPQQQPQHGQPPAYQQPGSPYGMQPMPYYPPQKKGMPAWAWVLIVGGVLFAFLIVAILALAAIPLITSNTRDARRAEGEQMMQSAMGQARIAFAKTNFPPGRLTGSTDMGGADISPMELEGKYYRVDDAVGGDEEAGELRCSPVSTPSDGNGMLEFRWTDGQGKITWGR